MHRQVSKAGFLETNNLHTIKQTQQHVQLCRLAFFKDIFFLFIWKYDIFKIIESHIEFYRGNEHPLPPKLRLT
jgi:hypothetical protein